MNSRRSLGRHQLYERLNEVLGPEPADTLMERTELHQSLRLNMLVTVGVLGTLITVVGALT